MVGSRNIIAQRIQQVLALWHFSAGDSVRTIWQDSAFKRSPTLWGFAVPHNENSSTMSVVYGHRRGIGTSFYAGATFSRDRNPDAGFRHYQTEVFVKGSWTLEVL